VTAATGLTQPTFTTPLPSGHYFWRVTARAASDPSNDWQHSVNGYLFVDVP
jgi:hypothetical protein